MLNYADPPHASAYQASKQTKNSSTSMPCWVGRVGLMACVNKAI